MAREMSYSEMTRRICLVFRCPPSVAGLDDPVGESMVGLARQHDKEALILRRSPGDFAAAAARAEEEPHD